jgi:hypothetical protein
MLCVRLHQSGWVHKPWTEMLRQGAARQLAQYLVIPMMSASSLMLPVLLRRRAELDPEVKSLTDPSVWAPLPMRVLKRRVRLFER